MNIEHNIIFFLVSLDPYIMEERDPLKSQAIESSLWELQTLQNHILPNIATAAKFINMPLPAVEWDMSKILENSADDVSKTSMTDLHQFVYLSCEVGFIHCYLCMLKFNVQVGFEVFTAVVMKSSVF
jgi:hypothetical protein